MLKLRNWLILCSALSPFAAQAVPETFCVSQANVNCFGTIQQAVNAADNDGDTIKIAADTYFEAVDVPAGKDGLTLMGSSAKNTIIDTGNLADNGLDIDSPNVTVIGLGVKNSVGAVAIQVDAVNFTMKKSEVVNADSNDCLDVNGDFAIIEGNRFFACGDAAMDITGNLALVSKNKIIGMDGGGMDLNGDNHTVTGNSCELIEDDPCIVFASGSDSALVEKNKVIQAEGIVHLEGTHVNPRVLNNQIIEVGDDTVDFDCITDCSSALVEGNKARGGTDDGGTFDLDFASVGGIVRKNTVLKVMDGGFDISGAGAMLLENNTVTGSDAEEEDCFSVSGAGVKTLRNNKASNCTGSGFDVADGAHVLEKNTAKGNAENGFELLATTNGAMMIGNTATGNSEEGIQNEGMNNIYNKNTAKGNRSGSDFCESGAGTVLGMGADVNKFGSMSTDCVD